MFIHVSTCTFVCHTLIEKTALFLKGRLITLDDPPGNWARRQGKACIRESVDSLCRDGTDVPIM